MSLPIPVSVSVSTGQRVAFHITTLNKSLGTGIVYTTSPSGPAGNLHASNADLELYVGVGTVSPFASTYADRIWNGRVYYSCP